MFFRRLLSDSIPFPHQYLVSDIHQLVFHIFPRTSEQLNVLLIQVFKQFLGYITPIPEEFPVQFPAQYIYDIKILVINVAWGKAKGAYLCQLVDTMCNLKP